MERYELLKGLMNSISQMSKTAHDNMVVRTKEADYSPQQFHLLNILLCNENCNQKELSKVLNITPATLSVRIQRLEKAGLLCKEVNNNDKRNFSLKVTDKGRVIVEQSREFIKNQTIKIFENITDDEIIQMNRIISKLHQNIKQDEGENNVKD